MHGTISSRASLQKFVSIRHTFSLTSKKLLVNARKYLECTAVTQVAFVRIEKVINSNLFQNINSILFSQVKSTSHVHIKRTSFWWVYRKSYSVIKKASFFSAFRWFFFRNYRRVQYKHVHSCAVKQNYCSACITWCLTATRMDTSKIYLKCFPSNLIFSFISVTAFNAARSQSATTSAPEYPSVLFTSSSMLMLTSTCIRCSLMVRISRLQSTQRKWLLLLRNKPKYNKRCQTFWTIFSAYEAIFFPYIK